METQADSNFQIGWVLALAVALLSGSLYSGYRYKHANDLRDAQEQISAWPAAPRLTAGVMIEKYGPPDRSGPIGLVWFKRGPWKRIVVHQGDLKAPLEQVVDYDLRPQGLESLRAFGHGIVVDPDNDELSAQSESESKNFLALNLADEVASGGTDLQQAQNAYDRTADLAESGKSSAYTQGLLFQRQGEIPSPLVKDINY
jgi:hypothetical protein